MNTVKHSKGWNLQPLPKKRFLSGIKPSIPAIILSSLIGTYLDLYFVGNHLYSFPLRPFPAIFSINILCTLLFLPAMAFIFLYLMERWDKLGRVALILLISLAMSIMERISENLGLFIHSDFWIHTYTFVGNGVYFTIIYVFHLWFRRNKE